MQRKNLSEEEKEKFDDMSWIFYNEMIESFQISYEDFIKNLPFIK